jgi:hypothetical protein
MEGKMNKPEKIAALKQLLSEADCGRELLEKLDSDDQLLDLAEKMARIVRGQA